MSPKAESLETSDFSPYNLSPKALEWILQNIGAGSRILELGSGLATRELAKFYAVTSVEEDRAFCNRFDARFFHAPITDGYYSSDQLISALANRYDLIIIDGPIAYLAGTRTRRLRFQHYLRRVEGSPVFLVDDVQRFWDLVNFALISMRVLRGFFLIRDGNKLAGVIVHRRLGVRETFLLFRTIARELVLHAVQRLRGAHPRA